MATTFNDGDRGTEIRRKLNELSSELEGGIADVEQAVIDAQQSASDAEQSKIDAESFKNQAEVAATNAASDVRSELEDVRDETEGFRDETAQYKADFETAFGGLSYLAPVEYDAGIDIDSAVKTVEYDGEVYAPLPSEVPFTTSGTFEADRFRLVVGVIASDLASTAPGKGALMVRGAVIYVDTIADLQALDTAGLMDGQVGVVKGIAFGWSESDSLWKNLSGYLTPDVYGQSPGLDESSYINQALSDSDGMIVKLSPRVYLVENTITIPSNTTFDMCGGTIKLKDGSDAINILQSPSGASNITVKNGRVDGNGFNLSEGGGWSRGFFSADNSNITISDMTFVNVRNVKIQMSGENIFIKDNDFIVTEQSTVEDDLVVRPSGILIYKSDVVNKNIRICNNYALNLPGDGFVVSGSEANKGASAIMTGNVFEGFGARAKFPNKLGALQCEGGLVPSGGIWGFDKLIVSNNIVRGVGATSDDDSVGVNVFSAREAVISGNIVENLRSGIRVGRYFDAVVSDNVVKHIAQDGIFLHPPHGSVVVSSNIISNYGTLTQVCAGIHFLTSSENVLDGSILCIGNIIDMEDVANDISRGIWYQNTTSETPENIITVSSNEIRNLPDDGYGVWYQGVGEPSAIEKGNTGWPSEASGYAVVPEGASSVTISPIKSRRRPDIVFCQAVGGNYSAYVDRPYEPSNSLTTVIRLDKTAAEDVTVYWEAKHRYAMR